MDAGVVHHVGKGDHATIDLLGTAVVCEVALYEGYEAGEGVVLMGCPKHVVAALDACGEQIEHVVAEDIEGE